MELWSGASLLLAALLLPNILSRLKPSWVEPAGGDIVVVLFFRQSLSMFGALR